MTKTGVFLTEAEYQEVVSLIQHTMQIDLSRRQNIYETNKKAATERLQEFAAAKGLPLLKDGKGYGLTSERELATS